ncbi:hypothetical protein PPYR_06539 [Photinus pyralis]|uniref:Cytohesin Ubiquitin Protein Inducing domain-containing protein n=1 Tax=Photinus pyralis TaxID=7054 RepID=A0A1Y1LI16_PHOPY|nr:uncharacterized protein LOC116166499 isoform X1 [Photinus pyralis]KAB0800800.1 hypothetical protein PPYR_06539 [Photinus pyralis]
MNMEHGVPVEEHNSVKMGASGNPNAAKLAALQERKQVIEEALAKRNKELRQLCIQEAELTGTMPTEIPLDPGESPPLFRRRIGTAFQLPQNLVNSLTSEDESFSSLELNMQVQANMAEAALSLANEANISKTMRRQHMAQYQYHKRQYNALEEKFAFHKTRSQMVQPTQSPVLQHQKQRKKPRPPDPDDTISMNAAVENAEPFGKTVLRHSIRSLQHPVMSDNSLEFRHSSGLQKLAYRSSDGSLHSDLNSPLLRPEDAMISGIYRLSLNGYKTYMERKEINSSHVTSHFISSQSNPNLYHQTSQPIPHASTHTLPYVSQRNPQTVQGYLMYPQYSPTLQQSHEYPKFVVTNNNNNNGIRQSSSPGSTSSTSTYSKSQYYPPQFYNNCRQYANVEQQCRTLNPHQIQPHQQYEHDVMNVGLGGYWKRTESGESVWCNSTPNDTWQRDKRFGSLDRRRNKRLHKRTSPLVDQKCATISVAIPYYETARPAPSKPQQIANRNRPDSRQLVRTQSLGSVGAQTVDSVWPSDDNSSCGSDAHSINEVNLAARKQKQKEWFETSLDGPAPSIPTRSHSVMSSAGQSSIASISPEEQYMEMNAHKSPLEIPAESNPQPSLTVHEPNMELFNNNIPKHGTLIQAGQCKPYHEETKPFEMSDFYKYSTKFKKSPIKQECNENSQSSHESPSLAQSNLNPSFGEESPSVVQKVIYQPLQPMKCQPFSPDITFDETMDNIGSPTSLNSTLNFSQLTSNVAENFSAEMNAWYQNQEQVDNNNTGRHAANNRSTATLV